MCEHPTTYSTLFFFNHSNLLGCILCDRGWISLIKMRKIFGDAPTSFSPKKIPQTQISVGNLQCQTMQKV